MEVKSIEELYDKHLAKEPKKYRRIFPEFKIKMKTREYIGWEIEKENLEGAKSIPLKKRKLVLEYLKNGNKVGDTAKHFKIDNTNAVFYLIGYNLSKVNVLNEASI